MTAPRPNGNLHGRGRQRPQNVDAGRPLCARSGRCRTVRRTG